MKNCIYCSAAIEDGANFCPNCGGAQNQPQGQQDACTGNNGEARQQNQQYQPYQQPPVQQYQPYPQYQQPAQPYSAAPAAQDSPSFLVALIGFFIPIVGLILYLVWKDETPQKAKSAIKGAITSIILWVVLGVLIVAFSFVLVGSGVIESVGGML